jgi:hypothetical protein
MSSMMMAVVHVQTSSEAPRKTIKIVYLPLVPSLVCTDCRACQPAYARDHTTRLGSLWQNPSGANQRSASMRCGLSNGKEVRHEQLDTP